MKWWLPGGVRVYIGASSIILLKRDRFARILQLVVHTLIEIKGLYLPFVGRLVKKHPEGQRLPVMPDQVDKQDIIRPRRFFGQQIVTMELAKISDILRQLGLQRIQLRPQVLGVLVGGEQKVDRLSFLPVSDWTLFKPLAGRFETSRRTKCLIFLFL